jgi:hypothetical protein
LSFRSREARLQLADLFVQQLDAFFGFFVHGASIR